MRHFLNLAAIAAFFLCIGILVCRYAQERDTAMMETAECVREFRDTRPQYDYMSQREVWLMCANEEPNG